MQRRIALFITKIALSAVVLLCSLTAKATNYQVTVDFFGLSPDPININVGDSVFWVDGDGGGPYTIYFSGGAVQVETPNGLTFPSAGTYYYFDDLGDYGTVNVGTAPPNSPP